MFKLLTDLDEYPHLTESDTHTSSWAQELGDTDSETSPADDQEEHATGKSFWSKIINRFMKIVGGNLSANKNENVDYGYEDDSYENKEEEYEGTVDEDGENENENEEDGEDNYNEDVYENEEYVENEEEEEDGDEDEYNEEEDNYNEDVYENEEYVENEEEEDGDENEYNEEEDNYNEDVYENEEYVENEGEEEDGDEDEYNEEEDNYNEDVYENEENVENEEEEEDGDEDEYNEEEDNYNEDVYENEEYVENEEEEDGDENEYNEEEDNYNEDVYENEEYVENEGEEEDGDEDEYNEEEDNYNEDVYENEENVENEEEEEDGDEDEYNEGEDNYNEDVYGNEEYLEKKGEEDKNDIEDDSSETPDGLTEENHLKGKQEDADKDEIASDIVENAVKARTLEESYYLHHPFTDISLVSDRIPEPRPKLKNGMADGFHGEMSGTQKETKHEPEDYGKNKRSAVGSEHAIDSQTDNGGTGSLENEFEGSDEEFWINEAVYTSSRGEEFGIAWDSNSRYEKGSEENEGVEPGDDDEAEGSNDENVDDELFNNYSGDDSESYVLADPEEQESRIHGSHLTRSNGNFMKVLNNYVSLNAFG